MSEKPGPILVAGARGNQGGAALRHLLVQGWKVRAMTRQPDSEKSRSLRDLGAELVRADYDDRTSLAHAPSCGMPSSLTGSQVPRSR